MNSNGNPMRSAYAMHLSLRCGARTRSSRPCCGPAMPNGRCRMHGGSSPGAPKDKANGMFKHGRYSNEALAERRELSAWIRMVRQIAEGVA